MILQVIVGAVLILGGLCWALLVWGAAGMADRTVSTWSDIVVPCLWSAVPIGLGIVLIVYR